MQALQGHQLGSCYSSQDEWTQRPEQEQQEGHEKGIDESGEASASNTRNVSREREMRVKIKTKIPNNRSRMNSTATVKELRGVLEEGYEGNQAI